MKFLIALSLLYNIQVFSQTSPLYITNQPLTKLSNGLTNSQNVFIENVGQYGDTMPGYTSMDKIKYGFEGLNMPVLFTEKGLIHLQRKVEKISEKQERQFKKQGLSKEEIERKSIVTDKVITMEWFGANAHPEIIAEETTTAYHTYGLIQNKAKGFKRIIYKDLYPGIDLIYHFSPIAKIGFEYSLVLKPGADVSLVKMKYDGDIKKIYIDKKRNLVINSDIDGITETVPVSFSASSSDTSSLLNPLNQKSNYPSTFTKDNSMISFSIVDYDKTKTLVIDPFISSTANLTGANAGIAKDIDFDYAGNIYVAGGGGSGFLPCMLAKFDANGVLQWTFNGTLTTPSWTFGASMGGWVVEKTTGSIYLGQGLGIPNGSVNIRLNTTGMYDNYITDANIDFLENWKMQWTCNNGNPKILIAGGSNNSNNNFAICSPPSTVISGVNITGSSLFNQDIADIVFDPATNDMYTIYASAITPPFINNRIYKHKPPYTVADIIWQMPSGFNALIELDNRPYLAQNTFGNYENSANLLAVNTSYLFYWDGLHLKAFNKIDGTNAGSPLILNPNIVLRQGGIIADECNNIFIGNTNGTIKVYKFNGSSFDDAAAADITIAGYPTASVYDLAYDHTRQLLYASGNGFVASIDVSAYCATTVYSLAITTNCSAASAQATLSPTPPAGSVITYVLFNGATQVASNTTGLFTGLSLTTTYTVKAFIDQACGGIQVIKDFNFTGCPLSIAATFVNPSCGLPNGSITAVGSFGSPPYQFSIDGINFQATGIFTSLAANNYTITVKDALNATNTLNLTLVNSPPLLLNATPGSATCNLNNGTITASGSGGTAPLQYSINGTLFQLSTLFTGLAPAAYTVTVKDANSCTATFPVTVGQVNTLTVNAGSNFTICQGTKKMFSATSNGTSFSWFPVTGLSNPAILNPDASPSVTTPYTLTATSGTCTGSSTVTVFVNPAPIANAGNDTGICFGKDAMLIGSGGVSFLWKPSTYLSSTTAYNPVVIRPNPGLITYFLSVVDANGCNSLIDDVVIVDVSTPPLLFAGNDTSIIINRPFQLHAVDVNNTGFINYTWLPVYGLNNPGIANPVTTLDRDIVYTVTAQNTNGCVGTDDIKIVVYQAPEILVPNAFTPDGNGTNDFLKAIPLGIKEFKYFTVFNNYGQKIFTTVNPNTGWDGTYKGKKQAMGTYVWIAEGIDFRGRKIQEKGTVILIR